MTPEQFEEYDCARPEIWHWFCHYAEVAWRSGVRQMSQDHIMHQVRSQQRIKVLNASVAGFARKYVETFPTRARFFVLKPSMADMGRPASPQMEMFA